MAINDRAEIRHRVLGVMFTMTTYGTWLRGDERGWVEDGRTYPSDPGIEAMDRARLDYEPFLFEAAHCLEIGDWIGTALIERLKLRVLALTVRTWHVHLLVAESAVEPSEIAKCVKDRVRFRLKPNRPIWTEKYDKRFCCDEATLIARISYVEAHNIEDGLGPRPWSFMKS